MTDLDALAGRFPDLAVEEITVWIERRWVRPAPTEAGWHFEAIDIARLDLVYDLRRNLGVSAETLPVVLGLLDQVHDLRARLAALAGAIEAQPAEVRDAIAEALREG